MNYIYIRAYFYVFDGQNCFIVEFIDAFSTKICPFTLPLRKIIKSMKIEIKNKIGNRRGGGCCSHWYLKSTIFKLSSLPMVSPLYSTRLFHSHFNLTSTVVGLSSSDNTLFSVHCIFSSQIVFHAERHDFFYYFLSHVFSLFVDFITTFFIYFLV